MTAANTARGWRRWDVPGVRGWILAFCVMTGLFAVPMFLVGYPVLADRMDLAWMLYAGLLLSAPATLGYLWFCIGRR